jgi:hypothetical protein
MQPASPPPSPAPAIAAPKLSSLALYSIAGIAIIAIAAIFGFILFASGLSFTSQLWWMGLSGLIFAFLFYMVYASTHNRTVAFPLSGAFFVIGVGSFYGSIFVDANQVGLGKLVLSLILSIFVVLVLVGMFYMARGEERDAIRKSQRRITP